MARTLAEDLAREVEYAVQHYGSRLLDDEVLIPVSRRLAEIAKSHLMEG